MTSTPPQPEQVLPLLMPAAGAIWDGLCDGIEYANDLQPDEDDRDSFFWSHSARFSAGRSIAGRQVADDPWEKVDAVPNFGIHIRFDGLHVARIVKSLGATTPHAGSNVARRRAWDNVNLQGQLALASGGTLPPLSVILDWMAEGDEPVIHVGLPAGNWKYGTAPKLHWRVPLPEAGTDLSQLKFDPQPDLGGGLVTLKVDPVEDAASDK